MNPIFFFFEGGEELPLTNQDEKTLFIIARNQLAYYQKKRKVRGTSLLELFHEEILQIEGTKGKRQWDEQKKALSRLSKSKLIKGIFIQPPPPTIGKSIINYENSRYFVPLNTKIPQLLNYLCLKNPDLFEVKAPSSYPVRFHI
jgi:hypothetical protein